MHKILETKRLYLREMTQDDFSALCRILQDAEVMTAYEHAFDDAEVQEWLDKQRARYKAYGFGLWAVVLKSTDEMIGQCGLTMQDCDGCEVLEIGYLFQKAAWHKGYATEAAIACKRYAFDVLHANEVYSIIRDTNTASRNVALRNGMTRRGLFVKHYYGMAMPHDIYAVQNGLELRWAVPEDLAGVTYLASLLWPDTSQDDVKEELGQLLSDDNAIIVLSLFDGEPVGFAQCQLRHDYVEGTKSSPVGYLEGIFVVKSYRKQGIARKLLRQCESWAKEKGCTEFASDCELTNTDSLSFHLKAGFTEANRIICFRKDI